MTNLQTLLTELKRLEREATPGKWAYAYEYTCLVTLDKNIKAYEQGAKGSPSGYHEHEIDLDSGASNNDKSESNGQFIAVLRNASPVLIEACETALKDMTDLMYWLDKKEMSDTNTAVRNTLAQAIRKLDALYEREEKENE